MLTITLKAARINSGLSQKEAAKAVGITDQTLGKYEKNSSSIPMDLLNKLSELYQIPKDNIFLGESSKKFEQRKAAAID